MKKVIQTLPDLGKIEEAEVIEICVTPGDSVVPEQTLIVIETEKVVVDLPAEYSGRITSVLVKLGDLIAEGDAIVEMEVDEKSTSLEQKELDSSEPINQVEKLKEKSLPQTSLITPKKEKSMTSSQDYSNTHAGPSVRKMAREFGLNLEDINGSGKKGRILVDDLKEYVRAFFLGKVERAPKPIEYDLKKFGNTETISLEKGRVKAAFRLTKNWQQIPHVTNFEEIDITDLEIIWKKKRKRLSDKTKLSILPYLIQASVACLKELPKFNSSLSSDGKNLIHRQYYNIGIAVDTPKGLVVPVVKDVDKKSIEQLSEELNRLVESARGGRLPFSNLDGATFTISSLGLLGGTGFTPIIDQPQVAILGVSRILDRPIKGKKALSWKRFLPVSLSYDHRVVNGADAGLFLSIFSTAINENFPS